MSVLQKFPFSSMRTIADSLNIPALTIYAYLMEKIGLENLSVHWIPHRSISQLAHKRLELPSQFLRLPE
jgi:hypothetical protein